MFKLKLIIFLSFLNWILIGAHRIINIIIMCIIKIVGNVFDIKNKFKWKISYEFAFDMTSQIIMCTI